jgi:phosphoglycolate phosphatase
LIRLACLDMAGTTVRDDGIVDAAFREAMDAVDSPVDSTPGAADYVRRTMGLPKEVVFRGLLGDEARARAAVAAFDRSVLAAIAAGRVGPLPGSEDAFAAMRGAGVAICLTTGFTSDVQEAIVEALGWRPLVDLVLCPGPGVRGRPFPDLVLTALLRQEIDDVREVAVAGDTSNDLLAGHRAGASVLAGVLTGTHSREELEAGPHTHVLESIALLPAALSS